LFSLSDSIINDLTSFKGELLIGPRTNTKTADFHINLDSVAELFGIDIKLDYVETLRPTEKRTIEGVGTFHKWLEHLKVDDKPISPLIDTNRMRYLAGWPDEETLISILSTSLNRAGLKISAQENGLRLKNGYCIDYLNRIFYSEEGC